MAAVTDDIAKVEARRARQRAYMDRLTKASRDIDSIPPIVDPGRRATAATSLRYHLEVYHPSVFNCPWAAYHLALIQKIELSVWSGGWFAMAVPRGGGKSVISQGAAEWSMLHGHKRWPVLIGATSELGQAYLNSIKQELLNNDFLAEDFPEIVVPVQSINGEARRCKGQTVRGFRTAIEWGEGRVVFPTLAPQHRVEWLASQQLPDAHVPKPNAGSRLTAHGLTGSLRGMNEKTVLLESIRPDLAICDDPQTRESAKSYTQSNDRASIIKGDIAYLAGPETPMSVVVPCTVIYRGDLADQMLDRNLSPEFRGERHKMVITFPKRVDLWDRYAEIRRTCLRLGASMTEANAFYEANRADMDDGAEVSWNARFGHDCVSAIQHAMNLKIRDEASFLAEAQNSPVQDADSEAIQATAIEILAKQGAHRHRQVPQWAEKLVAGIDVQQRLLFHCVAAGSTSFEVAIIDYGTTPEQGRSMFSYRDDGLRTIQDVFTSDARLETQLYKAIQAQIAQLALTKYQRDDGVEMSIGRILVDCNWMGDTVIKACRESPFSSIVLPVQGLSVMAKDVPLSLRPKKPGETPGHEWLIKPKPGMKTISYGQFNANYWKTQLHLGFKTSDGPGAVWLWKDRGERHRMFAEHCNAETATRVKVKERMADEWTARVGSPDNHLFDTAVHTLVGLSMSGCSLPGGHETEHTAPKRHRKTITRAMIEGRK